MSAPIPGDPAAVQALADEWARAAGTMTAAADELGTVSPEGVWIGDSADAFGGKIGRLTGQWREAATALSEGAAALSSYASVLAWARGEADAALAQLRALDDTPPATPAVGPRLGVSTPPATTIAVAPVDRVAAARAQAQVRLDDARQAVQEAGDRTAAQLDGTVDWGSAASAAGTLLRPRSALALTTDAVRGATVGADLTVQGNSDGEVSDAGSLEERAENRIAGFDPERTDGPAILGAVAAIGGTTALVGGGAALASRLAARGTGSATVTAAGAPAGQLGALPPRAGGAGDSGSGFGGSPGRRAGGRLRPTSSTARIRGLEGDGIDGTPS